MSRVDCLAASVAEATENTALEGLVEWYDGRGYMTFGPKDSESYPGKVIPARLRGSEANGWRALRDPAVVASKAVRQLHRRRP